MKYGIKWQADGEWWTLYGTFDTKGERDANLKRARRERPKYAFRPFRILEVADIERRGGARALRDTAQDCRDIGHTKDAEWLEDVASSYWPTK